MNKLRTGISASLAAFLFAGCSASAETSPAASAEASASTIAENLEEEDTDETYDESTAVKIALNGSSASAEGSGVSISGSEITITSPGTYVLSGTLEEGRIVIDCASSGTVHLVFNNASVTSTSGSAIQILQADKTILTSYTGTSNEIAVSGSDEDGNSHAVYAKDDLVLNGSGTLRISSEDGDGIHVNDDLKILNTILEITAGSDGIDVNDEIYEKESIISITADGDGIKCQDDDETSEASHDIRLDGGMITITAGDDGIQVQGDLYAEDGTYEITAGGGSANAVKTVSSGGFGAGQRPEKNDAVTSATADQNSSGGMPSAPQGDAGTSPSADQESSASPETDATEDGEETSEAEEDETSRSKGISAGGSVWFISGTWTIDAADDAVNSAASITVSDGVYELSAGDDGTHADDTLTIDGGTYTITASYEGLEACSIVLNGGVIDIAASDDGINTSNSGSTAAVMDADDGSRIEINGGTITVTADGDGIDTNGSGTMSGGTVTIYGPENSGNGALDYNGTFTVTGGTLYAGSSAGMVQAPGSDSSVYTIEIGVTDTSGPIEVKDPDGNTVASYTSDRSYGILIVSSDAFLEGETYTVYQNGTELGLVTISDSISYVNTTASSGQGMRGGGRGSTGTAPGAPDSSSSDSTEAGQPV
ncbi:MAG: carbohydrate-binding domain-containing protein [Bulleidia sp.]